MSEPAPEIDEILWREAEMRARCRTAKQLAQVTGLTPKRVANLVARYQRKILAQGECSTPSSGPLEPEKNL